MENKTNRAGVRLVAIKATQTELKTVLQRWEIAYNLKIICIAEFACSSNWSVTLPVLGEKWSFTHYTRSFQYPG
jgi:hypothetical protein